MSAREFWYLVGLTAVALAGFIGGVYVFARIFQGLFR
jgi:hypothetical protein